MISSLYQKRLYIFVIIFILFAGVRMGTLFFSPATFHEGELYLGTIARELSTERSWPFFLYQNEAHEGGSLVVGSLGALFFKLCGEHLITLKMISFSIACMSFVLFIYLLNRYVDRFTSYIGALYFALGPPLFLIHSVITMGKYYELILVDLIALILFLRIFNEYLQHLKINNKRIVALGLINGFGVYFSYMHIVFLLASLMFIFLSKCFSFFSNQRIISSNEKKSARQTQSLTVIFKKISLYIAFFLLGFFPWFLTNQMFGYKGFSIHERALAAHFAFWNIPARTIYFFTQYIPEALQVGGISPAVGGGYLTITGLSIIYFICFFVKYFFKQDQETDLFQHEKSSFLILFSIIYLGVFTFMYVISDFVSSPQENYTRYKYLFIIVPYVFILQASFVKCLLNVQKKQKQYLSLFSMILLLMPALLFVYQMRNNKMNTYLFKWRPYSYSLMGSHVVKFENQPQRQIDYLNKISLNHRIYAYRGFGTTIAERFINDKEYVQELVDKIPLEMREMFYIGVFIGLLEHFPRNFNFILKDLFSSLPQSDVSIYKGLGVVDILNDKIVNYDIQHFSKKGKQKYYQGLGIAAMYVEHYKISKALKYLKNIAKENLGYCFEGIRESGKMIEYKHPNTMMTDEVLFKKWREISQ